MAESVKKSTPVNRFAILNAIDVGEHIEKKNGLSYLSWAWAWTEFKKRFPDSYYTVYEHNGDGLNYFSDGRTAWVKTGVTLVDGDYSLELIEMLPIMDHRNKSIPVENITSMDVNKAIQRSMTKAIARHGLGCYIYAGEDLPEETEDKKQQIADSIAEIDKMMVSIGRGMKPEEKIAFCNDNIKPIIGSMNYKTCREPEKLERLIEVIKPLVPVS